MIERFKQYLEGKFDNKLQAFSNPTRYAHIRVTHVKINEDLFYGEQAYNYMLTKPYRQFVLKPIEENGIIRVINYELKDAFKYVGATNLKNITQEDLTERTGCATIFKDFEGVFHGEIEGCECYVNWRGVDTYLLNKIQLAEQHYFVLDKGMSTKSNSQIWGSQWGEFKFYRMPD
jgi:CpeT protein